MRTKELKHGPYQSPPVVVVGSYLTCEVRGVVKVVGISDSRIPWPIGERDGKRQLIVYRSLARAALVESASEVAKYWGITAAQVKAWKSKLVAKQRKGKLAWQWYDTGRPWTKAEDALLAKKLTNEQVAKRTGRTVISVRTRRNKLRRKRP